jgi:alanine dehydrogenase
LVADAARVWRSAELIVKVKEPLPSEYGLIQPGQAIFTYLHLAAGPELAKVMLKKQVLGIGVRNGGGDGSAVSTAQADVADRWPALDADRRVLPAVAARRIRSAAGRIAGTMPGHVVVISAPATQALTPVPMAAGMARAR